MSGAAPSRLRSALVWVLVWLVCAGAYATTASGRMTYPDDEVVFQTARALADDGTLAIPGIDRRTAEPPDRPTGSFGVAVGRDDRIYGFFGHGLSVVAIPAVRWGQRLAETAPPTWRHAVRSDLFAFYRRSQAQDWPRIAANFVNVPITATAVVVLGLWVVALGASLHTGVALALIYGLGTAAWPYTSTFLSEPLSALMLLGAALGVTRFHRASTPGRARIALAIAGLLAGLSVHVHVLNVLALPCLIAYALAPLWFAGNLGWRWRDWLPGVLLGLAGIALLAYGQWWRFGDPWQTGRYHNYGRPTWPFEALAAFAVAPGRAVLLYSPPLVLGLLGWRRLHDRDPALSWLLAALFVTRLLVVCTRTDWYGGWGLGARYLVPMVPFALVPAMELLPRLRGTRRTAAIGTVIASALLQAYYALHAIFEHMWWVLAEHGRAHYYDVSHWRPSAMPLVGFWRLDQPALRALGAGDVKGAMGLAHLDAMAFGALRLGVLAEQWDLFVRFVAVAAVSALAGVTLLAWAWRTRARRSPAG